MGSKAHQPRLSIWTLEKCQKEHHCAFHLSLCHSACWIQGIKTETSLHPQELTFPVGARIDYICCPTQRQGSAWRDSALALFLSPTVICVSQLARFGGKVPYPGQLAFGQGPSASLPCSLLSLLLFSSSHFGKVPIREIIKSFSGIVIHVHFPLRLCRNTHIHVGNCL